MLSPGARRVLKTRQSSGRWFLGSQAWLGIAVREDALLGARLFLVAAGAADGRVVARRR